MLTLIERTNKTIGGVQYFRSSIAYYTTETIEDFFRAEIEQPFLEKLFNTFCWVLHCWFSRNEWSQTGFSSLVKKEEARDIIYWIIYCNIHREVLAAKKAKP